MTARRLGDMSPWLGFFLALVTAILAGGAAWGAASFRIVDHDEEIRQLRLLMTDVRDRLAKIEGKLD